MSDAQDELIRERAYAIWQAEGCPHGRDDQHWRQAVADLAQAQDEATQRDEPVLPPPKVASTAPEAVPTTDEAPPVSAVAPAPARRGRKSGNAAPAPSKARRKKES